MYVCTYVRTVHPNDLTDHAVVFVCFVQATDEDNRMVVETFDIIIIQV